MQNQLKKLNSFSSLEELNQWLADPEFNKKLLQQIDKDFAQLKLELDTERLEIISQIQQIIDQLLHDDLQKLMNLLYRIDISEQKIHEFSEREPQMPKRDIITFLLIQRETQKILFREFYR